jgi:hypothetical protein
VLKYKTCVTDSPNNCERYSKGVLTVVTRCLQTFQSRSHLLILGTRQEHEASSIPRTHFSGLTSQLHCYLTLSAGCMWTDTHFYMKDKKLQWLCWKYKVPPEKKVSLLGNQATGICGTLVMTTAENYHLVCNAVYYIRNLSMFQKNVLPPTQLTNLQPDNWWDLTLAILQHLGTGKI